MTKKERLEKEKRFIKLGWDILKYKYFYYERNISAVPDHQYDVLERTYDNLAKELNLSPTASDMVGFDNKRPSCQLVVSKYRWTDYEQS